MGDLEGRGMGGADRAVERDGQKCPPQSVIPDKRQLPKKERDFFFLESSSSDGLFFLCAFSSCIRPNLHTLKFRALV